MVGPLHQTPKGQSVTQPGSPPKIILVKSKHDIKVSEGNMLNPIFKGNVQGRKHPRKCAFAEPKIRSYRKPKRVLQNENNGHKNPKNSHN